MPAAGPLTSPSPVTSPTYFVILFLGSGLDLVFWCLINAQQLQCMQIVYCLMSPQLQCLQSWCLMINQHGCKQWLRLVFFAKRNQRALAGQQRALLLLVEIQCAQVEQNETKSQSPLTLIGKGRVYGINWKKASIPLTLQLATHALHYGL